MTVEAAARPRSARAVHNLHPEPPRCARGVLSGRALPSRQNLRVRLGVTKISLGLRAGGAGEPAGG